MSLGALYVLLGEMSVQVLSSFFNWVVCLPEVESREFFIYLEIKPLSEVSLANIFSHMFGSLFILLIFPLAVQKLFSLMSGMVIPPTLFFFLKIATAIEGHLRFHINV